MTRSRTAETRRAAGRRPARSRRPDRANLAALWFLLPALIVFLLFSWWPIVQAIVLSFHKTNLVSAPVFVGLDNFRFVLTDPNFWQATVNTLYFAALALLFGFPVPILVATLIAEVRKRRGVYTFLAYLPTVVPPTVGILLWKEFYDPARTGLFNQLLGIVGLGPLPWLQDARLAMPSLVLAVTWASAGAAVIIYLAALTSVPVELYEAAEFDGAGLWQKTVTVTLPHLRGVLFLMLLMQMVGTVQIFTEPWLMTRGGPIGATRSILILIYQYSFVNSLGANLGRGAAASVLLALVLGVFTVGYFRLTRRWSAS